MFPFIDVPVADARFSPFFGRVFDAYVLLLNERGLQVPIQRASFIAICRTQLRAHLYLTTEVGGHRREGAGRIVLLKDLRLPLLIVKAIQDVGVFSTPDLQQTLVPVVVPPPEAQKLRIENEFTREALLQYDAFLDLIESKLGAKTDKVTAITDGTAYWTLTVFADEEPVDNWNAHRGHEPVEEFHSSPAIDEHPEMFSVNERSTPYQPMDPVNADGYRNRCHVKSTHTQWTPSDALMAKLVQWCNTKVPRRLGYQTFDHPTPNIAVELIRTVAASCTHPTARRFL
jgi:hypothetical protein